MALYKVQEIISCPKGCCQLTAEQYIPNPNDLPFKNRNKKKAGVFIFDPNTQRVLMVQSRGHLWGLPKGTYEENDTAESCALREVMEETGIQLLPNQLAGSICIRGRITYYYTEMAERPVKVQHTIEHNDANGIGWVHIECLKRAIEDLSEALKINSHCQILLRRFFGYEKVEVNQERIAVIGARNVEKKVYEYDELDEEYDDDLREWRGGSARNRGRGK